MKEWSLTPKKSGGNWRRRMWLRKSRHLRTERLLPTNYNILGRWIEPSHGRWNKFGWHKNRNKRTENKEVKPWIQTTEYIRGITYTLIFWVLKCQVYILQAKNGAIAKEHRNPYRSQRTLPEISPLDTEKNPKGGMLYGVHTGPILSVKLPIKLW